MYDGAGLPNPDLVIDKNEIIGDKKVILMVNNANLIIGESGGTENQRLNIREGEGFFMAIVEGNIVIRREFKHPDADQIELEGIYFTENSFITEDNSSDQLWLRGILAAMGGLSLNRDLGLPLNQDTPSELFEYGPELLFHFPAIFSNRKTIWREVSP